MPVGQLEIFQFCGLSGEHTPLATLKGGAPLLARVPTKRGGVYFWATTPAPRDSSLAMGGVVLYAFVQRAVSAGAVVLNKARQLDAGDAAAKPLRIGLQSWKGTREFPPKRLFHRGVYRSNDRLLAVNRPATGR